MSYTIHVDPDVNCVFIKFSGSFEIGDMGKSVNELLVHPNYRQGMNILRDAREQAFPEDITYESISKEAKRYLAEFDQKMGVCKLAILVGDPKSYVKVHQFIVSGRLSSSLVERNVFRDAEKAKVWLGIPEKYEIKFSASV